MSGRLDTAVAEVRRAVRSTCRDLAPGSRVLVAASGGADSMALAAAAVFEGRAASWSVEAVVIDHQLQLGSQDIAEQVRGRLLGLGCDSVDVVAVSCGGHGGVEAAARTARYDMLESVAAQRGATVLLGHTRDDQAETVLLGLARGSGLRSLSGMAQVRGPFRRPLLGVSRDSTRRTCQALDIAVWDDPHNADTYFARVRVRRGVLPVLERELGPGVTEALARTAELARLDADALDVLGGRLEILARTSDGHLAVEPLAQALPAVRRRALRRGALAAGSPATDLTAGHVEAMDRLITDWHGQGALDLPGHVRMHREHDVLRFE